MGLSPIVRNILIGIPIGVTFVYNVGTIARVDGVSMQPTLNPDSKTTDYVFLSRWKIRNNEFNRGDIISFVSPKHPDQTLIKRVIGLEGDEINTIEYKLPYVRVPKGHCWVEGDHTGYSVDSNTFGPISLALVTARASCIVWPPSRWQMLTPDLPKHRIPAKLVDHHQRLQWDINGSVLTHGIVIGDVDNDGDNELVVGTSEGELYIFKGTEVWHKTTGLGLISCVAIGDIFNYGRNALVVVCGDGWVHIYYSPRSVNPSTNATYSQVINKEFLDKMGGINFDHFSSSAESDQLSSKMECVHLQRIPTNTKFILIADVDRDGANEMILGLTDRVVRSYRWSSNADLGTGKLIGLNKWECANQIGTVTLQHMSDGTPTLLVAQPGGTFMRIKCNRDDCELRDDDSKNEAAASCVDYQTLGISRMRNPNISTAIIGNLEPGTTKYLVSDESPPKFVPKDTSVKHTFESSTKEKKKFKTGSLEFKRNYSQLDTRKRSLDESAGKRDNIIREPTRVDEGSSDVDQVDGNVLGGNIILGDFESNPPKKSILPTYDDFSHTKLSSDESTQEDVDVNVKSNDKVIINSKPYALATLDGTIMLVKDEIILWAMQVDHLIFALSRLDVTGDGFDKIVVCAWDGLTYFLDQECNSVRFQFEEPVRAFCAGNYSLNAGTSTPSLVYATFTNKIFLYYDVMLPSMLAKGLDPLETLSPEQKKIIDNLFGECSDSERDKKMQQLTEYLLYGMKVDE